MVRRVFLSITVVALSGVSALAQTYTTATNSVPATGGSSNWTGGAYTWSPSTPTLSSGGATTSITFNSYYANSSALTYSISNNLGGVFQLNTLNVNSTTLNNSSAVTQSFAGSGLSFVGTNNSINVTGPSAANVTFGNSTPITFTSGLTLTGDEGINFGSGGLSGSGGLVLDTTAGVTFNTSANNTFTGGVQLNSGELVDSTGSSKAAGALNGTGTITINAGVLVSTNNATINNALVINGNFRFGDDQAVSASGSTFSSTVSLAGSVSHVLLGENHTNTLTTTFSGVVSGTAGFVESSLVNGGTTFVFSNTGNTLTGNINVISGSIEFDGVGSASTGSNSIYVNGGGVINAGTAYSSVTNWLGSGMINTGSTGAIATTGNSSENINFSTGGYNNLMLGSAGNYTYDGTLTPGTNGYLLGGGKFGNVLTINGTGGAIGANALTGSNNVTIGALGTPIALTGADGAYINSTFAGSALIAQPLVYESVGTVALNNSNNTTGTTTIIAGTLNLTAAAANTFGTLTNSTITVKTGATLAIDSLTATSIPTSVTRTAGLTLAGGTVTDAGGTASGNTNDIVGPVIVASGLNVVTVTAGANSAELSGTTLTQGTAGGGALVNGVNLGKAAPGAAADANVILSTVPMFVGSTAITSGGINSGQQNTGIIPYLVGEANVSSGGTGTATGVADTFLTYDTATGLRPLNPTDEFSNVSGTALVSGNNNRITGAATDSLGTSINSLVFAGGNLTISSGKTTTDASGAILFDSTNSISGGTLAFGSNTGNIFVDNGFSGTINGTSVTGSGGINVDLFGTGKLYLLTSDNYSGNVVLNGTTGGGILTVVGNTGTGGNFTIQAGTLTVENSAALGSHAGNTVYLGDSGGNLPTTLTINNSFGNVLLANNIQVQSGNVGAATIGFAAQSGTNSQTISGNVTLGSANGTGHAVTITSGTGTSTFSGAIADPTGLVAGTAGAVTITSTGTLNFGNLSNAYTGGTILNTGNLNLINTASGSGAVFGTGLLVIDGAVALTEGSGNTAYVNGTQNQVWNSDWSVSSGTVNLNLSGTIDLGDVGNGTNANPVRTLTVGSGAALTVAGSIIDGGNNITNSLTKAGAGILTLNGNNTYTGTTTVNAGTLQIGNGGGISNSTAVVVNSGGSLLFGTSSATNHIAGTVTLNGGTLGYAATSPSNTTTATGALTLTASSTLDFGSGRIGSTNNTLSFLSLSNLAAGVTLTVTDYLSSGTYALGATASNLASQDVLQITNEYGSTLGTQLSQIVFYDTAGNLIGNGEEVSFSGGGYEIVPISATPEPSTFFVPALFVGWLGWKKRQSLFKYYRHINFRYSI